LDTFVAQELSKLTSCDAPDLSDQFDRADSWISTFVLNSIFTTSFRADWKPNFFGILRRAQTAIDEYERGRSTLIDYLGGPSDRFARYFRALNHLEIAVAQTYQAYEFFYKMTGDSLFKKSDGSPLERLNRIYSVSKHLEQSSLTPGQLHHVWITNDGLSVSGATIKWQEFADLIKGIGRFADTLANPRSGGR